MKNFIFKSNESDLQKMFSILENLQKNVLYTTYRIDAMNKRFNKVLVDLGLQKQVDKFFDGETNEYKDETSPQTDSDEQ